MSTDMTGAAGTTADAGTAGAQTGTGQNGASAATSTADGVQVFDLAYVQSLRTEAAKYRTDAKANADAAAKLAKIEEATKGETQKAVDTARSETEKAIRAEVARDRVLDRVEVLAAKDFADAQDARLHLAGKADDLATSDGQPDPAKITAELTKLLADKPHLKAATTKRFEGGGDGGARTATKSDNPRQADLDQIEADIKNADRNRHT